MTTPISISEPGARFSQIFGALTGHRPYPWQESLFSLFVSDQIPADISLPTGAGKTSVMAIWLLALGRQAEQNPTGITIPRRLVWVVNRRVVVDQATSEAEQIAKRLHERESSEELDSLRKVLGNISVMAALGADALGISTLRGEKEDNRSWSDDPSRPSIIVGTVDMIGSRLLFSGYGSGRYWRAQHAGLLGHDTLLVNDEAHLTPAFAALVASIESKQAVALKPFRTTRLSATHPGTGLCWPGTLEPDRKEARFRTIFEAPKRLEIHPAGKQDSKLFELATEPGPARTLIFVRKPDKAQEIAERLAKKLSGHSADHILTLTGTMRGFERDQMLGHPVFRAFRKAERVKESSWIIATSAGEVGVNISADRLITDADTVDHLLQRFGRLNRFGESEGAAHLLVTEADEKDARKKATLDVLQTLPKTSSGSYDISTATLFALSLPGAACSELPLQAALHDWLIDVWSQTSLGAHPARPQVEPWLHGKQEDGPETYIAWREDVLDLASDKIAPEDREEVLQKYGVLAHERLREPTFGRDSLAKKFRILLENDNPATRILSLRPDGSVTVVTLADIADEKRISEIAYCHLLLPPGCGRLKNGMFVPECADRQSDRNERTSEAAGILNEDTVAYDVSGYHPAGADGQPTYDARACYRATLTENGWALNRLGVPTELRTPTQLPDLATETLRTFAEARNWRFLLKVKPDPSEGDESTDDFALLYFRSASLTKPTGAPVFLDDHCSSVGKAAVSLGKKLGLAEGLVAALRQAGDLHDLGKQEPIWQKAAGNILDARPVAKSLKPMRGRELCGFRHELASLRYAERELQKQSVPQELRDLALHLVAAHHGHARPCFEKKAYDRSHRRESERLALDTVQRFGRLQARYGAWGLAYLEAIFRCADVLASTEAEEQSENA